MFVENFMKFRPSLALRIFCLLIAPASFSYAETVSEVSQHGITWTFDQPYPAGQFITGDWWVIGPVKIVKVSPTPGPTGEDAMMTGEVKSRYGATSMTNDSRMRNGSMIVLAPSPSQGYDSRLLNYNPKLSVVFPLTLPVNRSLVSTISNEKFPAPVMHEAIMWTKEKENRLALESAAVLTCLSEAPPADAFRPPFAGTEKPIYQWKDIRWGLLPSLKPAGKVPDFAQFARYFERPWLDHVPSWMYQNMGPRLNQANYGREYARMSGMTSLMLMLDTPQKQKEALMRGFVQFGIDLAGLSKVGRIWTADGGHFNGRKWPILFAGMMLGDTNMQALATDGDFSEDRQTYYGKGWFGQTTLYQIGLFSGGQPPYEEKPPAEWGFHEKRQEGYRTSTVSGCWPGTALAVQLMGAKALWNHDAFFDYADRWMRQDDPYAAARGDSPRPAQEGKSQDTFVDAMWTAYRNKVPDQPGGKEPTKWIWNADRRTGKYIPNPKQD
jgi:hypothetical protein